MAQVLKMEFKTKPMNSMISPQIQVQSKSSEPLNNSPYAAIEVRMLDGLSTDLMLDSPSRIKHFEFIWITSGQGSATLDLDTIEIKTPVLICLAPGHVRSLIGPDLKGFYISLREDFLSLSQGISEFTCFSSRYLSFQKTIVFKPDSDEADEMKDVAMKIFKESNCVRPFRSEILQTLIKIFLIYISRHISTDDLNVKVNHSRDIEMVNRFMDLMKKQFKTMKKVSDYASQLCVTPNYLNQMVKRVSGYPASYHIQQQIVLEAKRQATYTGMRMKEIADNLGFHDYAHFSKFFKTYGGSSFSNFKNALVH